MYDYIRADVRYQNLKAKRREIIFSWAQREYRNLLKAREAGVRVPTPILCKYNILLMELIGGTEPAPKLKDHHPEDPEKFMHKVFEYIGLLYKNGLVHGDLSEFNILNLKEKPVFIDFSQGTLTKSPGADELLTRDINNLCRFSKKLGLKIEPERILQKIRSGK